MRFNLSQDCAWGVSFIRPYFCYHYYGKRLNINSESEYNFGYGIDLQTKIFFDVNHGWYFDFIIFGVGFRVWYDKDTGIPF